jgi:hypothetical protein
MSAWFYAKGGQQSGPVEFNQLVQLARSGALDPQKDLVWTDTMKDWQPAGSVEGLFNQSPATAEMSPAADAANPYAAPRSGWDEPAPQMGAALEEIVPGSDPIQVGACIKRAFEITKRHFGTILLVGITYFVILFAASFLFTAIDSALGFKDAGVEWQSETNRVEGTDLATQFSSQINKQGGPVDAILSQLLSLFLSLGLVRIGLNLVSGKEVSVAMLFAEGRKLLPAIGASIIFGAMVFVGLILLVVPGVYLALRYGQYMNAMVARDLGVIDSLKYSSDITTNNRLNLFALALMAIVIFIAGLLALVVGLIFAYPVIWLSWMVAFRWMQYGRRVVEDHPGTRTPLLSGV